ncbi:hypothetical protein B296_00040810 [Ensete ventricosum]|uniref:Uncharacterized protein n=1 Tax=Ensete ventricosum TaxID=4639 RepID=A0A426X367_ENSVE|nr:hypothetical protein B296_00040810 [Ensete ventricosum]
MLASACRPCGLPATGRPLCRGPWPQPLAPLQGALATTDRPLAGGQAMAGHHYERLGCAGRPSSSLLRLLRKYNKNAYNNST